MDLSLHIINWFKLIRLVYPTYPLIQVHQVNCKLSVTNSGFDHNLSPPTISLTALPKYLKVNFIKTLQTSTYGFFMNRAQLCTYEGLLLLDMDSVWLLGLGLAAPPKRVSCQRSIFSWPWKLFENKVTASVNSIFQNLLIETCDDRSPIVLSMLS